MTKAYSRFLTALFCLFLGGMLVWSLVLPDRERSEVENRTLSQWPEFSWQSLKDGSFTSAVEEYFADQFPLREQFRTLRSLVSYDLLGQRDVDGVYLSGGYAAKLDFPLNTGSVDRAAQRFRYVYDTYLSGIWRMREVRSMCRWCRTRDISWPRPPAARPWTMTPWCPGCGRARRR